MLPGAITDPLQSQDGTVNKDGVPTIRNTEGDQDSNTDSDMDTDIKQMTLDRKARNAMHRVTRDWNNRMQAALTKDVDAENTIPKSGGRKR